MIGEDNTEKNCLYSSVVLKWIKIYEYKYDERRKEYIEGNMIVKHGYLRSNLAIQFNIYLPTIPNFIMKYQCYDFTVGSLLLSENTKNGIIDGKITKKHTFGSILYYLVK
jgi:hypothetical protein